MAYPFNNVAIGVSSYLILSTSYGGKHMQHIRTSVPGTRLCSGNRLAARAICIAYGQSCMPVIARALPKECASKGIESRPQKRWLRKEPDQRASWYRLCDSHGEIATQVSGGSPLTKNCRFLSPIMLDMRSRPSRPVAIAAHSSP